MPGLSRREVGKALLTLVLAGCSPAVVAPPPSPTPARRDAPTSAGREQTTVVWSFWGDQKEVEINQRILTTFEAINPTIKVTIAHEPWETYFTTLSDGWKRQQSPDVMFLNNIPIYAATGALENLDPLITRDRYPIDDFYPALMRGFKFQDRLYALPRDNDTKVIFYNKRLLADAGLVAPGNEWTWEEFRQTAVKLTRRGADGAATRWGFAYEAQNWWRLWVWQNNGDILDDHYQPTRVRLDEPAATEAIQFLADLTNVSGVTPPYDKLNAGSQRDLFREGRVAMILDNHSIVPSLVETAGLDWDVAPLPRGRRRANLAGGAGYALSTWSTRKEAAWTFLKFLEGPEGQGLFTEAGVAVPARRSIREENIFFRRKPYRVNVFFEETELGVDNYYFPLAIAMNTFLDETLAPVFQGRETAASAVRRGLPQLAKYVAGATG